jgi:hypothetical protein
MKPYSTFNQISKNALTVAVALVISVASLAQGNGKGNSGNGGPNSNAELVFRNATLAAGTAGADGAVYRFPGVASGIDALVKINGRSSSAVKLLSIDLTNTGWDKAFQPQVVYNNGNIPAGTDWWMEFGISFVQSNSTSPATVSAFDVTALDIDGDGSKLREYVSLYNQDKYTTEKNTALSVSDLLETILGILGLDGKKFVGPVKQYSGIDTSATDVMTTNSYKNSNSFRLRTGGQASGTISNSDGREYAFWFKSFNFQAPVANTLPVILTSFNAELGNNNVNLKWEDATEFNFSHFIIERSTDGYEYTDAAMIFSNGNTHSVADYSYSDKVNTNVKGILYYRLKMVDIDGAYVYSAVRIIRTGAEDKNVTVAAYPNPVVNDLRVTVPQSWQTKQVVMDLYNMNGQVVKHFSTANASQTEVMNVTGMPAGMYVLKASTGTETATQKIVKTK